MTKAEIKALIASTIDGQGNQVDLGGKLGKILTEILDYPAELVREFVPKTAFVTEEIGLGEGATKYGLGTDIFGGLSKGTIDWVRMSNAEGAKRLRVIVGEPDKYILCGGKDGNTDLHISITMTDDGKYNIVVPA